MLWRSFQQHAIEPVNVSKSSGKTGAGVENHMAFAPNDGWMKSRAGTRLMGTGCFLTADGEKEKTEAEERYRLKSSLRLWRGETNRDGETDKLATERHLESILSPPWQMRRSSWLWFAVIKKERKKRRWAFYIIFLWSSVLFRLAAQLKLKIINNYSKNVSIH